MTVLLQLLLLAELGTSTNACSHTLPVWQNECTRDADCATTIGGICFQGRGSDWPGRCNCDVTVPFAATFDQRASFRCTNATAVVWTPVTVAVTTPAEPYLGLNASQWWCDVANDYCTGYTATLVMATYNQSAALLANGTLLWDWVDWRCAGWVGSAPASALQQYLADGALSPAVPRWRLPACLLASTVSSPGAGTNTSNGSAYLLWTQGQYTGVIAAPNYVANRSCATDADCGANELCWDPLGVSNATGVSPGPAVRRCYCQPGALPTSTSGTAGCAITPTFAVIGARWLPPSALGWVSTRRLTANLVVAQGDTRAQWATFANFQLALYTSPANGAVQSSDHAYYLDTSQLLLWRCANGLSAATATPGLTALPPPPLSDLVNASVARLNGSGWGYPPLDWLCDVRGCANPAACSQSGTATQTCSTDGVVAAALAVNGSTDAGAVAATFTWNGLCPCASAALAGRLWPAVLNPGCVSGNQICATSNCGSGGSLCTRDAVACDGGCLCTPSRVGAHCALDAGTCRAGTCSGHGACVVAPWDSARVVCDCDCGWFGASCNQTAAACAAARCYGHGACEGAQQCVCNPYTEGWDCAIAGCGAGGTWNESVGACQCNATTTGTFCDLTDTCRPYGSWSVAEGVCICPAAMRSVAVAGQPVATCVPRCAPLTGTFNPVNATCVCQAGFVGVDCADYAPPTRFKPVSLWPGLFAFAVCGLLLALVCSRCCVHLPRM